MWATIKRACRYIARLWFQWKVKRLVREAELQYTELVNQWKIAIETGNQRMKNELREKDPKLAGLIERMLTEEYVKIAIEKRAKGVDPVSDRGVGER